MALYINGEKIDEQEIRAEMERLRPEYNQRIKCDTPEEQVGQLYDWSRENVIERTLLKQAAMKAEVDITPEMLEGFYQNIVEQHGGEENLFESIGDSTVTKEQVMQDLESKMRFDHLIQKIINDAGPVSTEEKKAFYEDNPNQFMAPDMVRVSHIVKHVGPDCDATTIRDEMQDILKELDNGAKFADVAKKNSDCPENGGDLGFFGRGQMVPSFENVVFSMEVGEVSAVFQTEFGFHIAKKTDYRPARKLTFEEAEQGIAEHLSRDRQQKLIENFVDAEKAKATIEDRK